MQVLVADDDAIAAETLAHCLERFGYAVTLARNGREAFDLIRSGRYRLVVADWEMPEMSGVELCRLIRERRSSSYVYIVMLTSHTGVRNVVAGLSAGADDFLTKPFHPEELRVRLRAGERILSLESRDSMIFAMARLAESRDADTGAHLERMREYCRLLVQELATWDRYRDVVDGDYVELLYLTSPLHDIGKVAVPDNILLKPGPLTPEEFAVMKRHTLVGSQTLEAAAQAHPEAQFLTMARDIALNHHERFDGRGYPNGLAGTAIPLCARIVALADVYDALTSRRAYKEAFSHEMAKTLIVDGRSTQFDPDVVDAFLRQEEQFVAVRQRFERATASAEENRPIPAGLMHSPPAVATQIAQPA
jgi:putative two-component system response regulator